MKNKLSSTSAECGSLSFAALQVQQVAEMRLVGESRGANQAVAVIAPAVFAAVNLFRAQV